MISWAKPCFFGKEKEYLNEALKSTWISGGQFVDKFEEEFSMLFNKKYCVTASNGTTALHLALLTLGITEGDEVIVPGYTFVAPANVAIQVGAKPVYVEPDPETWCIDPAEVEKSITEKTKAIICVHVYGNVCEMDKLRKIAKEKGLYLIEDTAEAVFSKYEGKFAGSFGDFGCFSFQATKTITMGEGGAVLLDNPFFAEKMRKIKSHGMSEKRYWHELIGYNYRLTNLQAALGCAQLEEFNKMIQEKKRVYQRYLKNLSDLPGIQFQKITEKVEPVIWAVAVRLKPGYFKGDRDFIIDELLKRGIETRPGFYPFHDMPLYNAPNLPITNEISKNVISFPSYASLPDEDIDDICEQLRSLIK